MSNRRGWLLLAGLLLVAGILAVVAGSPGSDSPEHRSDNDGFNGTSALRQLAGRLGHPVTVIGASFELPDPPAILFVFTPVTPFSKEDAARLSTWVTKGGTLVYADDNTDTRVAIAFSLHRVQAPAAVDAFPAVPALHGLTEVRANTVVNPYRPQPNQATVLVTASGAALAIEEKFGQGRVLALAAPVLVVNGNLETADDGRLAADLLGLAPGQAVLFDEFHHNPGGASGTWTGTVWGDAVIWAIIAVFLGLVIRGRAFGPRIPLRGNADRSSGEYAAAVGHLLRQSGGRQLALKVAGEATRRSLAGRLGLSRDITRGRFSEVLAQRAPALAGQYEAAEREAAAAGESESALLRAARRLHALAYPIARR